MSRREGSYAVSFTAPRPMFEAVPSASQVDVLLFHRLAQMDIDPE